MLIRATLILIPLVLFTSIGKGQDLSGKVIGEDLLPLVGVQILTNDSVLLDVTDSIGSFCISISSATDVLYFRGVGLEPGEIKLVSRCSQLNLVMMYFYNYDFVTISEVNRLRFARFRKLDEVHRRAVRKGVFSEAERCYKRVFKYYKE